MTSRSARRADFLRTLAALRAELGGFALPFRLHALVDRLAVLLRQIGTADPHVDDLDTEVLRLVLELLAHLRHQRAALVADDTRQRVLAEHAAQRRVQQGREPRIGAFDRADRLIEPQRIGDLVAREGIDHEALLIGGDHFLRRIFEIEDALVDVDHAVDKRHLEMQPGLA